MEDQQAVAFVLMPFDAELDWIFDDVLAPSLAEVG